MNRLFQTVPPGMTVRALLLFAALAMTSGAQQTGAVDRGVSDTLATTATAETARSPFYVAFSADNVEIGTPITLRLYTRSGIAQSDIQRVGFTEELSDDWVLDAQWRRDYRPREEGTPGDWQIDLRPFAPGQLTLPDIEVRYRGPNGVETARIVSRELNVVRVSNGQNQSLAPLRDRASMPADNGWMWIAIATAALGAALLAWIALAALRRRRRDAPAEAPLPPGLWALREIDRRSALPVCQRGPAKQIFTHASEVIRLYIQARYGIHAIDMTTNECLAALRSHFVRQDAMRWIEEFLNECDMVKFTPHEPSRDRWRTVWDDSRLIVKSTTPAEELDNQSETPRERE